MKVFGVFILVDLKWKAKKCLNNARSQENWFLDAVNKG